MQGRTYTVCSVSSRCGLNGWCGARTYMASSAFVEHTAVLCHDHACQHCWLCAQQVTVPLTLATRPTSGMSVSSGASFTASPVKGSVADLQGCRQGTCRDRCDQPGIGCFAALLQLAEVQEVICQATSPSQVTDTAVTPVMR
jgi:hypothetical protein